MTTVAKHDRVQCYSWIPRMFPFATADKGCWMQAAIDNRVQQSAVVAVVLATVYTKSFSLVTDNKKNSLATF